MKLFGHFSGRTREPACPAPQNPCLIVAVHGGTYTSAYFDIPGFSLLDRAAAIGLRAIAPDRNGYGETPPLANATIAEHAQSLTNGLHKAWEIYGGGCRGIVLIGHSIGGAIAARIAAAPGSLPLLGIAISGVGLKIAEQNRGLRSEIANGAMVDMPTLVKDGLMFGPPGSFDPHVMPSASYIASAPAPIAELSDISGVWPREVRSILRDVAVPVHYRQAEYDRLWFVDDGEVHGFADALLRAPRVDAAIMPDTGHCMDFHRVSAALQVQQLGFALQCAVDAPGKQQ